MKIIAKAVKDYRISAIVSIHDINLALRFVDYLLMLKDGKVYFLSSKEKITPEDIAAVYGVDVMISKINEHQVIVPLES
jgi:iron complex transport system ATP-binding protein